MRLSLIINRRAGGFIKSPRNSGLETVLAILRQAGHELTVTICTRDFIGKILKDHADDPTIDAVIIGGGDGTIRSAILAGIGQKKPLGILPLGSLNLLARDLGIPLDPIAAAHSLASMTIAHIDLADVNGQPFVIWASLGIHPWIAQRRAKMQKRGMGHWYGFLRASLQVFTRYVPLQITTVLDGETRQITSPAIVISNNGWKEGGKPFTPLIRKTLNHNHLVLHVVNSSSRFSLLWMIFNALFGRWKIQGMLNCYNAHEVQVSGRKSQIMISVDGEVDTLDSPLHFTCKHNGLQVIVPEDSPHAEHRSHL